MMNGLHKLIAILALSVSSLMSIDESITLFLQAQDHVIEYQSDRLYLSHVHSQVPDHFFQKSVHHLSSQAGAETQVCTYRNDQMFSDQYIDTIWQPPKMWS